MLKWKVAQWLELHWWKNYFRGKDKTAYLAWKKNYWINLLAVLREEVAVESGHYLADFGCGPAGIFIAFEKNKLTATDPLLEEYEAKLPFFNRNDYPNVTFLSSRIEDFSLAEKFDLSFCMNAINHVHDLSGAYDVLVHSLKETGTLVMSVDAHNFTFFKHLFRIVPGDALHPHQHSLEEYKRFLELRSMNIVTVKKLKHEFFFTHYVLVAKK